MEPTFRSVLFNRTKIEVYELKYLMGHENKEVIMLIIPIEGEAKEIKFESIFSALQKKRELEQLYGQEVVEKELQEITDKVNLRWNTSLQNILNPKTPAFVQPLSPINSDLTQYSN